MDENSLLANERGIPWHLPRDVAYFREYTKDKWLLLGSRTFEEMRGWFRAGHMPLVLTRQRDYVPEAGHSVATINEALARAEEARQTELVCCGGAQIYAAALPLADRLVITQVQAACPPGNSPIYFPQWSTHEWRMVAESAFPSDPNNAYAIRHITLARIEDCKAVL